MPLQTLILISRLMVETFSDNEESCPSEVETPCISLADGKSGLPGGAIVYKMEESGSSRIYVSTGLLF